MDGGLVGAAAEAAVATVVQQGATRPQAMEQLRRALSGMEGRELCVFATQNHPLSQRCVYLHRTYDYIPFERIAYQNTVFRLGGVPGLTLFFHARDWAGEKRAGLVWVKEDMAQGEDVGSALSCISFLLLQMAHRSIFFVDESDGGSCAVIAPDERQLAALHAAVTQHTGVQLSPAELLAFLVRACLSKINISVQ
jgi:hypothetical protein